MNTLHFKYAVEVEKTRSITQAAKNLFMAQPNLSKAIKELEEHLRFPIFERTSKGVIPTQKGSEFLGYAQKILQQLEKMESLSDSDDPDLQRLNISIPRGSYIANAFTKFVQELDYQKAINMNMQETNSMQAISNVVECQSNFGVIRYQTTYENYFLDYFKDKQLCHDPIWEFDFLILMSKDHPLAEVKIIYYEDLSPYVEINHGDTIVPYLSTSESRRFEKFAQTKKKIYVYERFNQFELLSSIPQTFMWASPIPDSIMDRYNLIQRKCMIIGNVHKDVLIYPKGYKFTPLDKKFIDKLYESRNEVSFKEFK